MSTVEEVPGLPVRFNELFANFDKKEMVVHDEDAEVKKVLKDAQEAKCWLTNNVQNCWWNGERHAVFKSVYPSTNFGLNWYVIRSKTTIVVFYS